MVVRRYAASQIWARDASPGRWLEISATSGVECSQVPSLLHAFYVRGTIQKASVFVSSKRDTTHGNLSDTYTTQVKIVCLDPLAQVALLTLAMFVVGLNWIARFVGSVSALILSR